MVYNITVGGIAVRIHTISETSIMAMKPFLTTQKPEYDISFESVDLLDTLCETPLFTMSDERVYDQVDLRIIDGPFYRIFVNKDKTSYQVFILKNHSYPLDEIEYVLSEKIITEILAQKQLFLIHGSAIFHQGQAIIFSGHSQAGKTTLSKAWIKAYPDTLFINDDKPLLSFKQDKLYVSSHPWAGTEGLAHDMSAELKAIVFVQKGSTHQIIELSNDQKIKLLLEHVKKSIDPTFTQELLMMIENIIQHYQVIIYQSAHHKEDIYSLLSYLNKKKTKN